jgi:hypothetical protein
MDNNRLNCEGGKTKTQNSNFKENPNFQKRKNVLDLVI